MSWIITGIITLVFAYLALNVAYLGGQQGRPLPPGARPGWFVAVGIGWFAFFVYQVNRTYGRTRVSERGLQFETLFTRRFIAWGEITQVENRRQVSRGNSWHSVRVHFGGGKKRRVPGAFTIFPAERARRLVER